MESGQPLLAPREVRAFFRAADETYRKAAGVPISWHFRVGGELVRLSFAGPALIPSVTPAFAHLAVEPDEEEPDLTISIWDSVSTGTRMLPPPWPEQAYRQHNAVSFGDGDLRGAFFQWTGVLNLLDFGCRHAYFWISDAACLPDFEFATPFLPILHWWMTGHGRQLTHSAAVGTREGGLLIVGQGGVGKSTTALTGFVSGLLYAGDDYCLVAQEPTPCVLSLYSSVRIDPAGMGARFPNIMPAIANPTRLASEKALVFLQQCAPARMVPGFPARAVLIPSITGSAETSIVPATHAAALRATAPSTLFRFPGSGAAELGLIAGFLRRVPCYHLRLGTDLDGVARALRALLPDG